MSSLADLQAHFAEALRDPHANAVAAAVVADRLAPEARVALYRHHVFTSLTTVLRATYPVIARLVGEGFFGYAAHHFIRQSPPGGPCLFEYGEAFGRFLERFP